MTNISINTPDINPRERAYYLLFGTMLAFVIFLISLSIWFLKTPAQPSPWASLGQLEDFPPAQADSDTMRPYRVEVSETIYVWVVNIDDESCG